MGMLVIHWSLHNKTSSILANGLRPVRLAAIKGVWCYPFSPNKTLVRTWLRNLKTWNKMVGNYNGFVFRLANDDFPIWAGTWPERQFGAAKELVVNSPAELNRLWKDYLSGRIAEQPGSWVWMDFELIGLRHIAPQRIIKVIKDREPKHHNPRGFRLVGSGRDEQ